MQNDLRLGQGMDVKGSDGEKVGTIQDVQGDYVVISKGFFFPTDYYIPTSAITSADDDGAHLNVTKDAAMNQGWDAVPTSTNVGTTPVYETPVDADQEVAATGLRNSVGAEETYSETGGDTPFDHNADTGHFEDRQTIDVALTGEELTARTREVKRGEVQIEKDVVTEEQTLDVPVSEERVHVERRAVDRDAQPGDSAFEEGTIEVPVYGEEVEVDKRTRVTEELEISKDRVQGTEHVTDTVRREEAHVTNQGDVNTSDNKKKKRR